MVKLKGKQKRMILFIRIEVYYWNTSNKSQTKIVNIQQAKKCRMVFPTLKCNIRHINFLGSQEYL